MGLAVGQSSLRFTPHPTPAGCDAVCCGLFADLHAQFGSWVFVEHTWDRSIVFGHAGGFR